MSPAGYWPQLHAAIEAGADAVYFGLNHFSARAKVGFELEELPDVMRTLRTRGVKGYITFNTLVFDSEIESAGRALAAIAAAGADAIIVQDLGMVKLARQIAPGLAIHGSTQMSITSAEGIALAMRYGVSRVVLARELSLKDIRAIRAETECELEMFVHGALCVSYSGQCFSSEAWGGRSANRGQCAQACRLPYELIVDEVLKPLGDARYLLSPGDLFALHQVPEIVQIGISSLKIEGRYKDSDYVALTTRAYRKAVDEAWAGLALSATPLDDLQLEQVYSRGSAPHFITGTNHQTVVRGRAPRHRGVAMGKVVAILDDGVAVAPSAAQSISPLKAGDGVVFDAADWLSPQQHEEGGRVYSVRTGKNGSLELGFANSAINYGRVRVGDLLWRTNDPTLEKLVRPYIEAVSPVSKQSVHVTVTAKTGDHMVAEWRVGATVIQVSSDQPLMKALNHSLDQRSLREQLGRLGNTPYELATLEAQIEDAPFIPSSALNQLRREAVEQLVKAQALLPTIEISEPSECVQKVLPPRITNQQPKANPQLHLLIRSAGQLDAAIALRPSSITLDYLELYGLRGSVEKIQASGIEARAASPRILKPSEERIVHFLLKLGCPIVVRSAGLLDSLNKAGHPQLIGDFSLNAANAISAGMLLGLGLTRLTPSHDLNAQQIADLSSSAGPGNLEIIAYQHLPVFHMEHCVFCRFLSSGTTFEDCGHPCEKHRVSVRDENGRAHPVMADVGCRNTVFGAEAQHAGQHLASWLKTGLHHFRLEFVHETPAQVISITTAFAKYLDGSIASQQLQELIQKASPQGTTEGSLFVSNRAFNIL